MTSLVLTTVEVCELYGLSVDTLRALCREAPEHDPPPRTNYGRSRPCYRWDKSEIADWFRRAACRRSRSTAGHGPYAGQTDEDSTGDAAPTRRPRKSSSARSNAHTPSDESGNLRLLAKRLASEKR